MTFTFYRHFWRRENPITEPIEVVRQEIIDQWVSAPGGAGTHSPVPAPVSDQQTGQQGRRCCIPEQPQGSVAIEALQRAVADPDASIRTAALEALGALGASAPVDLLTQALGDPDWEVRTTAAQALGRRGQQIPVEEVIQVLQYEQDENVREALVRLLGNLEQHIPVNIVVSILYEDDNWLVRAAAAWALGELGEQAPIKYLIRALRCDPDESVRAAAARSLGRADQHEAEQPLLEALLDEDEEVRDAAFWALQQLDEETRGMAYKSPQADNEWYSEHMTRQVTQSAAEVALPVWKQVDRAEALFTLTDFIRDKKGCVRHRLLTNDHSQTLLLYCSYQHTGEASMHETLTHMAQDGIMVKSLEAALSEQDEAIHCALTHAVSAYDEQPWKELLMVSFALSHPSDGSEHAPFPLRVVVAGMSYAHMRQTNGPVLDQIVTTWSEAVEEPLACQHPHDLIDFTIWCQPEMQCSNYSSVSFA